MLGINPSGIAVTLHLIRHGKLHTARFAEIKEDDDEKV